MKINVYRMDYHTITVDEHGAEKSRTSPTRATIGATSLDEAFASLPRPASPSTRNVLTQSHITAHGVELAAKQPEAICEIAKAAREAGPGEESGEEY